MLPLERMLRLGLRSAVISVVLVAPVYFGYVYYRELPATKKAQAFCRDTDIGSPIERLNERAAAAGAVDLNNSEDWDNVGKHEIRWVRPGDGTEGLPVTFLGFEARTMRVCSITARGGVVISRVVSHLD
jgi:hypothetical protein